MSKTSILKISAQNAAKVSLWCVQVQRLKTLRIYQLLDQNCSRNLLGTTGHLLLRGKSSPRGLKTKVNVKTWISSFYGVHLVFRWRTSASLCFLRFVEPRRFIYFINEWKVYSEQAAWSNFDICGIFRLEICSQTTSHRRSRSWMRCSGYGLCRPLLFVRRVRHLCWGHQTCLTLLFIVFLGRVV